MIEQHLSILLVLVTLLAEPITAILPPPRIAWLLTLVTTWSCLLLAVWQLQSVLDGNIISYELGVWAPPWGIEYRIDTLNAFVAVIVTAIAAITLPYALRSVEREIPSRQIQLFYTAFLLCLVGLLDISQTGDIFNLFVFLEISSLSSYVLIAMGQQRRALTAAYQYLIMGTIGATFLLIGIGLLFAETGTLNMMDLNQRLQPILDHRTVHTGFAFIVVGIALKLALFPLHLWLPNAYGQWYPISSASHVCLPVLPIRSPALPAHPLLRPLLLFPLKPGHQLSTTSRIKALLHLHTYRISEEDRSRVL